MFEADQTIFSPTLFLLCQVYSLPLVGGILFVLLAAYLFEQEKVLRL